MAVAQSRSEDKPRWGDRPLLGLWDRPLIIGLRDKPLFIGLRERPLIIGLRERPLIGLQNRPLIGLRNRPPTKLRDSTSTSASRSDNICLPHILYLSAAALVHTGSNPRHDQRTDLRRDKGKYLRFHCVCEMYIFGSTNYKG